MRWVIFTTCYGHPCIRPRCCTISTTTKTLPIRPTRIMRELLELHALGVDAGYSQRDVRETARCLTGWTVDQAWTRGRFQFDTEQHDETEKTVLGMTIPANGGESDGERVFDAIRAHPALPQFITRKLVRRFVGLMTRRPRWWTPSLGRFQTRTAIFALRCAPSSLHLISMPRHRNTNVLYTWSRARYVNSMSNRTAKFRCKLTLRGWTAAFSVGDARWFPRSRLRLAKQPVVGWQFSLALAFDEIGGTGTNWENLSAIAGEFPTTCSLKSASSCSAARARRPYDATRKQTWSHLTRTRCPNRRRRSCCSPQYQWR